MKQKINIFWFRRDLRLTDNAGLYHALRSGKPVLPIFIFDTEILDKLEDRKDRRVNFIYDTLEAMQKELEKLGSTLHILHGTPADCYAALLKKYSIETVFTNHDYEPYANEREKKIAALLKKEGIDFQTYKDQVILEKDEVLKDDGTPYTVFTPYSKKWKNTLIDFHLKAYPAKKYYRNFLQVSPEKFPSLKSMGFETSERNYPPKTIPEELVKKYAKQRDFPGVQGTSHLGMHLRFGTISIRHLAAKAQGLSETFLNELIWREFYHMILWHFPQVGKGESFKPAYDEIEWEKDNGEFEKWCNGQTGYPIVDAGMRELNETGFMHNRVRMITASFLCKHLLLDWRLGEAYFAAKLLDFDLAANNGGWQWASSSGCDAAPYFRIFNPTLQMKRFDPDFTYIKKWVPEFQEFDYPKPIVEHEFARKRCLDRYSKALKKDKE